VIARSKTARAGERKVMQRSQQIVVVALQALGLFGCVTTDSIGAGQLARLDGFDAQQAGSERQIETIDGQSRTFNRDTRLTLDPPDQQAGGGRFASIHVQDGVFLGRTVEGREVRIRLSEVRAARIEQPDEKGTGIAVGILTSALVLGGLALLILSDYGPKASPGRALRLKSRVVTAPLGRSRGWTYEHQPELSNLSHAARVALATFWRETAFSEHASVPAFSRLSMTLMALGAPSHLVDAAHRAALEEIGHARIAFSMASAYAGTVVAPGPLTDLADAPSITATSLRALAAESLIDGCLMEGFASALIEAGRVRALDRSVRSALGTIGREEASHALLAWNIVGWCIEEAGQQICTDLLPLVERAPIPSPAGELAAAVEAEVGTHGLIGTSERRRLFCEARVDVAERLRHLAEGRGSKVA
jgi:hypothetical protein